jgi:hypothetical protein
MTRTIEIPEELAAALQAKAQAEGLSPDGHLGQVLKSTLADIATQKEPVLGPFKSSYGILAKYGPAPSDEDIAEARRGMWGNFPREFPED